MKTIFGGVVCECINLKNDGCRSRDLPRLTLSMFKEYNKQGWLNFETVWSGNCDNRNSCILKCCDELGSTAYKYGYQLLNTC